MTYENYTTAYNTCLSAIKMLTFRYLPYPSCAYADEEPVEFAEECNTFEGYGTAYMEMGTLYPCGSTGERLVRSRPPKARRKSWPSASNPSEVQAFYDKEISRAPTPASPSRRSSRVSTPTRTTPEPTTPTTPSCPFLTTSPSSCDSTFSVLDTPLSGYHIPMGMLSESSAASPTRGSRLPLSTSNYLPVRQRSCSPTPHGDRRSASMLTILSSKSYNTLGSLFGVPDIDMGPPAPIRVVNADDGLVDTVYMTVEQLPKQYNVNPNPPMNPSTAKSPGRIPRFSRTPIRRLQI